MPEGAGVGEHPGSGPPVEVSLWRDMTGKFVSGVLKYRFRARGSTKGQDPPRQPVETRPGPGPSPRRAAECAENGFLEGFFAASALLRERTLPCLSRILLPIHPPVPFAHVAVAPSGQPFLPEYPARNAIPRRRAT